MTNPFVGILLFLCVLFSTHLYNELYNKVKIQVCNRNNTKNSFIYNTTILDTQIITNGMACNKYRQHRISYQ